MSNMSNNRKMQAIAAHLSTKLLMDRRPLDDVDDENLMEKTNPIRIKNYIEYVVDHYSDHTLGKYYVKAIRMLIALQFTMTKSIVRGGGSR